MINVYGVIYFVIACTFVVQAILFEGTLFLMLWCACNFYLIAIAYFCNFSKILMKDKNGQIPFWVTIFFFPFRMLLHFSFLLSRLFKKTNTLKQINQNIYCGPRVVYGSIPEAVDAIIDLTYEFSEASKIKEGKAYYSFPILDGMPPSDAKIVEFIQNIKEKPVYIHCAMGHGRTSMFTILYLIIHKYVENYDESLSLLCEKQTTGMNSRQEAFTKELAHKISEHKINTDTPDPSQ